VQIRKLIERRIRERLGGGNVDADVHATVAANVGERGAVTTASSHQTASAGEQKPPERPGDDA
jgi:hypothetical protein